jgi:hypothetical protein
MPEDMYDRNVTKGLPTWEAVQRGYERIDKGREVPEWEMLIRKYQHWDGLMRHHWSVCDRCRYHIVHRPELCCSQGRELRQRSADAARDYQACTGRLDELSEDKLGIEAGGSFRG